MTCIDIRTGEELWTMPGTFDAGVIDVGAGFMGTTYNPVLIDVGKRLVKYDAITGEVLLDIEGIPNIVSGFTSESIDYPFAYVKQHVGTDPTTGYYLVKFRIDGGMELPTINDRIVWNATMDCLNHFEPNMDFTLSVYDGYVYHHMFPIYAEVGAFDATTGELVWHHPQDSPYAIEQASLGVGLGYGNAYFAVQDMHYIAYDLETGDIVWISEQTGYPWGDFWSYQTTIAYGMVYGFAYDGVYAFNASTGKINWHYSAGDAGMETPYGTWPFHGMGNHFVADGKVYAATCEHSPMFYYRGQSLHCIDAYTGDPIWSIMGYYSPSAVAEGTLFATNQYDGNIYGFSKGETATTVLVSDEVIAKGSSVLLKGTVLDQSPAQRDTPAMSDACMSSWMEYLHMQQPIPADAKGVDVTLDAIDPNGDFVHIGTVTSDMSGMFSHLWTPENEGKYTIIATFEGSDSYYASYAETAIGVGPAPSPAQPIEPEEPTAAPLITTELAIIAFVIVAVIGIVAFWILRKRK